MKQKLLLMAVALLCTAGVWADTALLSSEDGWQKITALPSNVGDYYFTIVDNSSDLMLTLSRGQNQGGSYNGLYYKTSGNPLADKSMLFTLEAYGDYYVMTNAEYNGYFLQTEYNAALFYRTHDNGGGNKDWGKIKLTYTDSYWTIQNGQYYEADGNYLGVWNDNTVAGNGLELALNKPSNMKGTYQIYAIAKTKANAYYDALREGIGASEKTPLDMTGLIVNPNARFWTGSIPFGWTTTGTQNVNNGTGYDGFPGIFEFSNWDATGWTGSLKQTITVPNGKYILKAAFMGANSVTAHLTANYDISSDLSHFGDTGGNINADGSETEMGSGQRGYTYLTLETKVTTGQIEIGAYAETTGQHIWINADNFTLTYLGADLDILKESYANALAAAKAINQGADMEASVFTALQNAISTYETVASTENALNEAITALQDATTNATNSIAAYASASSYFTQMERVLNNTNVYTEEAYNQYYKNWKDAFDAKTLETATAALLTADAAFKTGKDTWHAGSGYLDNILLSSWTIGGQQANEYDKALYINTWSTEGDTDGSDFTAPFNEYWVGDADVLGATTIVATKTGLKANTTYTFSIRARVRQSNDKTKIANGITMSVGGGENVDISAGAQFNAGQFYIGNFAAVGETDESGTLTVTITVAEGCNISWLSFYNCKYTEGEDLSAYIADYEFALSTANSYNLKGMDPKLASAFSTAISNATLADVETATKAELIKAKEDLDAAMAIVAPTLASFAGSSAAGWSMDVANGNLESNTWSPEGNSDGSGMTTPFMQNWQAKESGALSNKTISYAMTGEAQGYYKVTAHVRALNESSAVTPAGVFLFANDNIERAYGANASSCKNGVYGNPIVYCYVGEDGNLTVGFKIIGTNCNWISWKNLTIEYVGTELTSAMATNQTEEARSFSNLSTGAAAAQTSAISALSTLNADNYVAAGQAIEDAYRAIDREFSVLQAAIAAKGGVVLGFEDGEYAPYNLTAPLAAANAIDQTSEANTQEEINTAATNLNNVAANRGEVNAFYDGTFVAQAPKADATSGVKGWTGSEPMRQLVNDVTTYPGLNAATDHAGLYTWQGTFEYGAETGYQMPLKEGVYKLTFKIAGWPKNEVPNYASATLCKTDGTEVASKEFWTGVTKTINDEDPFVTQTAFFVVPADGDYKFKVYTNHLSVFNDFQLYKAVAADLALSESTAYTPEYGYANITLARTFKADTWATFVVPFDIDNATLKEQFGDDVQVSTISADDKSGVKFSAMETPAITANTPVIMKVGKTADSYSFDGVIIKEGTPTVTPVTGVSVVGNYAGQITIPSETNDYYYIASNTLKKSTGNQTIKGFRAYFAVDADAPADVKAFFDGFNFDGETTVKGIESDNAQEGVVFNLAGQRVQKAQKGLYIQNGKKVLVK